MSHQSELIAQDILAYLEQHERKEILRFLTCGSVDDGKSTLIGRLLHDSKMIYEDQLEAVRSKKPGDDGEFDLALLTDGLQAEREQGITIDVAYRYFSTTKRKFIIADTPGHEQYTRNMATGASTADVAVLLVDARNGVRTQSRRHARIARLLGINDFVLAINKMDLVDFDRGVFDNIVDDFEELLRGAHYHPIPISALDGDNVITNSDRTPWFDGKPLLSFLETVEVDRNTTGKPFRMPVQIVARPNQEFRGFAGQIVSGIIRPGDTVTTLPSGRSSKVKRIATWDGDLEMAHAPMSVTLTLEDEIDISRGDVLVADSQPAALSYQPSVEKRFEAEMVWMDERPLDPSRVYLLKHATRVVSAEVNRGLVINQIGTVTLTTTRPLVFDRYTDNRATGGRAVPARCRSPLPSASSRSRAARRLKPRRSSWSGSLSRTF